MKHTYLIIEFETNFLSCYAVKKHLDNYHVVNHCHFATTTEFLDGIIYNHAKLRSMVSQAVNLFNLKKPHTIVSMQALQKISSPQLPFHTLQIALCFSNTPTQLEYIVTNSLKAAFLAKGSATTLTQQFLMQTVTHDLLAPFKQYNPHKPTFWLSITGAAGLLLACSLYVIQTRLAEKSHQNETVQATLQKQHQLLIDKIAQTNAKLLHAKKIATRARTADKKLQTIKYIPLLLTEIEKTIPSDTFLQSFHIAPSKSKKNLKGKKSPSTLQKVKLKGAALSSSSAINFFSLLEKTMLFKKLQMKALAKDTASDAYHFEMEGIVSYPTPNAASTL